MNRPLAASAMAAAALAVTACSSGSPSPAATVTVTAQPPAAATQAAAKPAAALPVLQETGATQQVSYGYDAEGDGNASGQFSSGEQVTVYTFADQAAMDAAKARNEGFSPTSSYVWITGHLLAVEVTGVTSFESGKTGFPVSPQKIAALTGGTLVTS